MTFCAGSFWHGCGTTWAAACGDQLDAFAGGCVAVPRCFAARGLVMSVLVVAELPRQKDILPVALAREHVLVRRPHRPELKEREPEIRAGIFATLAVDQFTEGEVPPVQCRGVLAQAGPEPGVTAGRANVRLARDLVVDDVDAFHVLEGTMPVGSLLRDDDFKFCQSVIDLIMAGERLARVGLRQDRHDLDPVQMRLKVKPYRAPRQAERNHEPPDEGAYEV